MNDTVVIQLRRNALGVAGRCSCMADSQKTTAQTTLTEAIGRPDTATHPHTSRTHAREWYWEIHDKESYQCPDCGRGQDRVTGFDVHHKDDNPLNNDPENLVGLCERCHSWRHHEGPTLKGLDTEEWKEEFARLGSEDGEDSLLAT